MIPNDLTIVDGVATGSDLTLKKVSEQNGSSIYRGSYASGSGDLRTVTMTVKHTVPVDATKASSHLVRFDLTRFDSAGEVERTMSAWTTFRSSAGIEPSWLEFLMELQALTLNTSAFKAEFKEGAY